jgi:hypothetical protein
MRWPALKTLMQGAKPACFKTALARTSYLADCHLLARPGNEPGDWLPALHLARRAKQYLPNTSSLHQRSEIPAHNKTISLRDALIYSASGMNCKKPGAQSSAWPFH